MKRMIRITISSLLCGVLLGAVSCSDAETPNDQPTEREARALVNAEPGAAATEYRSRNVTLRLFGTQAADDEGSAFATLADTTTFATQNYRLGETIGRNLKLYAIRDSGIELVDVVTGMHRTVEAGQDFTARIIEHDFDRAALDQGQHQWTVKGRSMARLAARYGLGSTVVPMERAFGDWQGVKLGAVDRRGVLGRLGLIEGDLLLAIDGREASVATTAALSGRFAEQQSQVLLLTIARGGNIWEAAYVVE